MYRTEQQMAIRLSGALHGDSVCGNGNYRRAAGKGFSDVLSRVRCGGERFAVQRNGETIATNEILISQPGITVSEFIARVGDLEMPGNASADDLEAIQAAQGNAEMPEWPDRSTRASSAS